MSEADFIKNVFSPRHEALSLLGGLEALRANNGAVALELLEEQLDNRVLAMDAAARQASSPERERIAEVLQVVRDYRQNHPRHAESDLVNVNRDTEASLGRIQERVKRILDGTE
jgi:hypothetical protein